MKQHIVHTKPENRKTQQKGKTKRILEGPRESSKTGRERIRERTKKQRIT